MKYSVKIWLANSASVIVVCNSWFTDYSKSIALFSVAKEEQQMGKNDIALFHNIIGYHAVEFSDDLTSPPHGKFEEFCTGIKVKGSDLVAIIGNKNIPTEGMVGKL